MSKKKNKKNTVIDIEPNEICSEEIEEENRKENLIMKGKNFIKNHKKGFIAGGVGAAALIIGGVVKNRLSHKDSNEIEFDDYYDDFDDLFETDESEIASDTTEE